MAKRTLKELEDVSVIMNRTECKDMVISQDCDALSLLAAAPRSCTHCSQHGLHRVVAAFTCSVFASISHQSLNSSSLVSQFLPF